MAAHVELYGNVRLEEDLRATCIFFKGTGDVFRCVEVDHPCNLHNNSGKGEGYKIRLIVL